MIHILLPSGETTWTPDRVDGWDCVWPADRRVHKILHRLNTGLGPMTLWEDPETTKEEEPKAEADRVLGR